MLHLPVSLRLLLTNVAFLAAVVILLTSCTYGQSGPQSLDSGANNLTLTGPQLAQYALFRFDTSASERTLTLPRAADIASTLSVPAGTFTLLVIIADGSHNVKVVGGTNVIVKPSAADVPANTTRNIYVVLTNVNSGSESVTVY